MIQSNQYRNLVMKFDDCNSVDSSIYFNFCFLQISVLCKNLNHKKYYKYQHSWSKRKKTCDLRNHYVENMKRTFLSQTKQWEFWFNCRSNCVFRLQKEFEEKKCQSCSTEIEKSVVKVICNESKRDRNKADIIILFFLFFSFSRSVAFVNFEIVSLFFSVFHFLKLSSR